MRTPVALFFDDNFRRSFSKVAALYESLGHRAIFCNVAAPPVNWQQSQDLGDWDLWNDLSARGHGIHPHGFDHTNLATIPFADACRDIEKCLDCFIRHLQGFAPSRTIFHYPFNSATDELITWTLKRVAAIRIGGPGCNSAETLQKRIIVADAFGPENCAVHLRSKLCEVAETRPALFCYNLHGVDGEGWGPLAWMNWKAFCAGSTTIPGCE
ncbi:polysaccharide deacetylase family protein [Kamptonema cortianum]|nr:polysaccharide deacetylase family protein [Kamptonema cortianum]